MLYFHCLEHHSSFGLLASLSSIMGVTSTLVETGAWCSDLSKAVPLLMMAGAGVTITDGGWLLLMTSSRSTSGMAGVRLTVTEDEDMLAAASENIGCLTTLRLAATDIGSCNWGGCCWGAAFVGVTVTAELGRVMLPDNETWGCESEAAAVEDGTEGMAVKILLTLPPSVVK